MIQLCANTGTRSHYAWRTENYPSLTTEDNSSGPTRLQPAGLYTRDA